MSFLNKKRELVSKAQPTEMDILRDKEQIKAAFQEKAIEYATKGYGGISWYDNRFYSETDTLCSEVAKELELKLTEKKQWSLEQVPALQGSVFTLQWDESLMVKGLFSEQAPKLPKPLSQKAEG